MNIEGWRALFFVRETNTTFFQCFLTLPLSEKGPNELSTRIHFLIILYTSTGVSSTKTSWGKNSLPCSWSLLITILCERHTLSITLSLSLSLFLSLSISKLTRSLTLYILATFFCVDISFSLWSQIGPILSHVTHLQKLLIVFLQKSWSVEKHWLYTANCTSSD